MGTQKNHMFCWKTTLALSSADNLCRTDKILHLILIPTVWHQRRAWGQIKSTQGVGMGGGIPLPYVRKKSRYELNGGFSCIFWT